jgi:predicted dithiol-disulfide oxidoreductase (DUF899 family)
VRVVTWPEWIAARHELMARENELIRLQEQTAAARRALPWVKVEKQYFFDTPDGKVSLAGLFDERHQLIVKHNTLNPKQDMCTRCSFEMDHIEGALAHLPHRDVTFVAVSRAPLAQIRAVQRRMGWSAKWVSSYNSDFNHDYHVSFKPEEFVRADVEDLPGYSVFYRDDNNDIYLTYASIGRGHENFMSTYVMLDMTPKGRNETPPGNMTAWVRPHDRYDTNGYVDANGQFIVTSC